MIQRKPPIIGALADCIAHSQQDLVATHADRAGFEEGGILSQTSSVSEIEAASCCGKVVFEKARFTVISPICVRMEYVTSGDFVDDSTLFAINRKAYFAEAAISRDQNKLTIDTGKLRLEYRPNCSPFNAENLKVVFSSNGQDIVWVPGANNGRNLGGPVPTLDDWSGPQKLPDGLLSRDGWYLLDDSGRPLLRKGWAEQRRGGAPHQTGIAIYSTPIAADLDWYLFAYGEDYKGALRSLALISGKVPMPRRHALGSWYCRWHRYTADDFREIVREYNKHDFPLDILVMDMDWHTQSDARVGFGHANKLGWTGYTWDKALIPDPEALLREFKNDGIAVVLNDHPCDGMRDHEENYQLFMQNMPDCTRDNSPFHAGDPHYMAAFFKAAHEPVERQGIDFWWLDWQQDYIYPSVLGIPLLQHLPWLNHLYYRNSERDGRRGASFSRWGGWGDHRHPIHFSGDTISNWDMLAFEVSFSAASGNGGCFFWAHDIGGFTGERNPELFTRWVQFGALSAALRLHSYGDDLDRRPWLWGEPFESAMRSAYKLRAALLPYIYSSVWQCHDETLPLLRPMYLEHPREEEAYLTPQQYMLGDLLLAAPIAKPGHGQDFTAEQDVWLPAGSWYHFITGEKFVGGRRIKFRASIGEIPLFIKGGIPIPLQPETLRMTKSTLTTLTVRVFPGEGGSFTLYEDDGQSNGYTANEYATTILTSQRSSDLLTLRIGPTQGTFQGQVMERECRIELPATQMAVEPRLNGRCVTVQYDSEKWMNVIAVPKHRITEPQILTIKALPITDNDNKASQI